MPCFRESRLQRAAAICGIVGPPLFTGVVVALSFLERGFMSTLGWNPVAAPTHNWPSGLALGPLGLLMTGTFLLCGLLLSSFALGLRRTLRASRAGPLASLILCAAGMAMCFLTFSTDPADSPVVTLHGRIHDAAFLLLGLTLLASLVIFGFAFLGAGKWRAAIGTWMTAALVVPSFTVKGIVFYFFLAAALAWIEIAAVRVLRGPTDAIPGRHSICTLPK